MTDESTAEGGISVREAGRRGGAKTRDKHGREFYVTIGRMGGRLGGRGRPRDFHKRIDKTGGEAILEKHG